MRRREFLKSAAVTLLPWSAILNRKKSWPLGPDGLPLCPESLKGSNGLSGVVTNPRLRYMMFKLNKKKQPDGDSVREMWCQILPMIRKEPGYFVALRGHFGLDTTKGWVEREIRADYVWLRGRPWYRGVS